MEKPSKKHFADSDTPFDLLTGGNGTRRALDHTTNLLIVDVAERRYGGETSGHRNGGQVHP